jgi:hypothetical protein
MYNSLFLRLQPATLLQIVLHLEATLHKLTDGPSKAKNTSLARSVLVPVFLLLFVAQTALAGIIIDSGAGQDTVMQVGGAGNQNDAGSILIQSDPDNGSLMLVTPPPAPPDEDSGLGPVIIVPEIRIKE